MNRSNLDLLLAILALLMIGALPVQAQTPPTLNQYSSADGSFTFSYPKEWEVLLVEPTKPGPALQYLLPCCLATDMQYVAIANHSKSLTLLIAYPTNRKFYQFMGIGGSPEQIVSTSALALGRRYETPEPFDVVIRRLKTTTFVVNGHQAARLTDNYGRLGALVAFDVGSDAIVLIVTPNRPEAESALLQILETMRYSPPAPITSGNAALPQVYSGSVGSSRAGNLKFFYPTDWYTINVGWENNLRLGNGTSRYPGNPSEVQVIIHSIKDTQALADPSLWERKAECIKPRFSVSEIAEKQFARLPASFTKTEPKTRLVNGHSIIFYRYWNAGILEYLVILVDTGSGNSLSLEATYYKGQAERFLPTLLDIAGTLTYTPLPCQ